MTLQVRPKFASDETPSLELRHARKDDGKPVVDAGGAVQVDGIGSPRWTRSGNVALLERETRPAARTSPGEQTGVRMARTNIVRCLRELAAERPGDTAFAHLLDDDAPQASITYAQLDRRARAIAAHLQDMGLAGQRVVLAYPPGLEFIAAFFGALYAGCVAVPAYPPRHARSIASHALAGDAGARVVLSTAAADRPRSGRWPAGPRRSAGSRPTRSPTPTPTAGSSTIPTPSPWR